MQNSGQTAPAKSPFDRLLNVHRLVARWYKPGRPLYGQRGISMAVVGRTRSAGSSDYYSVAIYSTRGDEVDVIEVEKQSATDVSNEFRAAPSLAMDPRYAQLVGR